MQELPTEIPLEVLLALSPEELGAKMLFLLRKRRDDKFHPKNLHGELWHQYSAYASNRPAQYPREKEYAITQAIEEAWAWLVSQGLLIPTSDDWVRLSRRARAMESEAQFASFTIARLLPRELLHPKFADPVWLAFMRGEYDVAVFQAMKAVEVAVRDAAGFGNDLLGVKLMQEAFKPNGGPLADQEAEAGEQVGRMQLFAGAIGSYKNPQSHRDVDLNDPAEAMEIIYLANHLLRIVDARSKALRASARQP